MPLTKDKYFELIDSNSDYPHFRCALGAYIPGSLYKYFSIPDDSDEARKRFEQLKSGEIWFSKRSGLNDPFEFEHIALKGAQNDARQYYLNKQQELEVCCFSALLYNKLMWSHYAAGYKGYCVEFRVESPERFYPVIYENEVPDLSQEYTSMSFCTPRVTEIFSIKLVLISMSVIIKIPTMTLADLTKPCHVQTRVVPYIVL